MRPILPAVTAIILATPVLAQDPAGISSSAISRCAGKLGGETRQSDPAFAVIMLDGLPWTTVDRTGETLDGRMIAATVSGTGARSRRDGTSVTFRFTCGLDTNGQALMFHASQRRPGQSDASAPATTVVAGWATYAREMALPRGAELRVQLLDVGKSPAGSILTEQIVRSGWKMPIPFALHLPKDTPLKGRKLVVTARLVVRHQTLFQLAAPHIITGEDLHKPIELVLGQVQARHRPQEEKKAQAGQFWTAPERRLRTFRRGIWTVNCGIPTDPAPATCTRDDLPAFRSKRNRVARPSLYIKAWGIALRET
jgi:uncharacterized lipoprotein YbaY